MANGSSSTRTDDLRQRLRTELEQTAAAPASSVAVIPEAERGPSTLEDIGQRFRSTLERVGEQPLFEASAVPDIRTANQEEVRRFLENEPTTEITLSDAAGATVDLVLEPLADLFNFGKQLVLGSAQIATAGSPEGVGLPLGSQQALEATQFIEGMSEEDRNSALRGLALTGASLVAFGPVGTFARQGIIRTAGGLLKALPAGTRAAAAESSIGQFAARLGLTLGNGAAEGTIFGGTYGALKPLDNEEQSRTDAILHDAVAFGLVDAGFRGAGLALGTARRALRPSSSIDERQALREMFAAFGQRVERRGSQRPMPAEPLSAEETAAQVAAGTTRQGATKTGVLAGVREVASDAISFFTQRFPEVAKIDQDLRFTTMQFLNTKVGGLWTGRRATQLLTSGMTEQERGIFGRALVESRLKQVQRDRLSLAAKLDRAESAFVTGQRRGIEDLQARFNRQGVKFNDEGRAVTELNGKQFTAANLRDMAGRIRTSILTQEERQVMDNSLRMREALDDLENVINPVLTELNTRNGVRSLAEPELPFISLLPATRRDLEQKIPVIRARTDLTDEQARSAIEQGIIQRVGRRRAGAEEVRAARTAFGQAPGYVVDVEKMIRSEFGNALGADFKNEAVARIVAAPYSVKVKRTETSAGNIIRRTVDDKPLPETMTFQGREFPTRRITLTGNPQVLSRRKPIHQDNRAPNQVEVLGGQSEAIQNRQLSVRAKEGFEPTGGSEIVEAELGEFVVPKPVADMWQDVFGGRGRQAFLDQFDNTAVDAVQTFMDFNVRALLSSPVEAFAHSNRVLSQAVSIPTFGETGRGARAKIANKLGFWFGPRMTGLSEIFNVYRNPEALRMEAFLATEVPGAIPTRAFPFEFATRGVGDQPAAMGAVTEALEAGRRFLFNLPEIKPGLVGFDSRTRVSGALALRRITRRGAGREPTPREYSEFLEQFGQYTDEIQSNLVNSLRRNRVAPFAGTQAGFIPGEIRKFFGNPNLPKSIRDDLSTAAMARLRAETLWRGTIGTSLMLAMMQKALTDDFPWENEQGHKTDLKVGFIPEGGGLADISTSPQGSNARPVYAPLATLIDPVLGRSHRIVGARATIENLGDAEDIASDALIDLANTALTFGTGAPGVGAAATLATGSAPFIAGEGELLRLTPPEPNDLLRAKNRFFEAAGTANPTVEAILGVGKNEDVPTGVRILNAATTGVEVGSPVRIGASGQVREERAELFEIARDRANRALKKFPNSVADRRAFFQEEAQKFGTPEEQRAALRAMLRADIQIRRSRRLNELRGRRQRPFP